jgi:hypothetical protein
MFLQALWVTMLTRVILRMLPLPRVRRIVNECFRAASPRKRTRRGSASHVTWAAVAAGRYSPLGTTCLTTALVAQAMLQRHGYEARLRIGVRRNPNGEFTAHAWLERGGEVIVGGPVQVVEGYSAFPAELDHLIA